MKKILRGYPSMRVPLFESGYIVFCDSLDKWVDLHNRLGVYAGDGEANGMSHTVSNDGYVIHIIGLFNGKSSTLAHECAHMAFDICHRVGVNVEAGAENETFCHLVSRMVEFCDV